MIYPLLEALQLQVTAFTRPRPSPGHTPVSDVRDGLNADSDTTHGLHMASNRRLSDITNNRTRRLSDITNNASAAHITPGRSNSPQFRCM